MGGGAYDPLVSFETKLGVWLLLWEVLGDLRRSGNYGDLLLGNCKYFCAFKVFSFNLTPFILTVHMFNLNMLLKLISI